MRGEWIEMDMFDVMQNAQCLSPCGESGLKLHHVEHIQYLLTSLPMRGEWIEITIFVQIRIDCNSLSPCGESGLKF